MDHDAPGFRPVAALAAFLFPGAGHYIAGERARGLLIAAGVLGLFFGGMFIGGIGVVDSRESSSQYWFFGEALVGPIAFGVDYLHQNSLKVSALQDTPRGVRKVARSAHPNEGRNPDGSAQPGGTPPYRKSIAKINELGMLFATIAGMMNLIAIIDAALPSPRPKRGGLQTRLEDAERGTSVPTTVDDPRRGGTPGVKP